VKADITRSTFRKNKKYVKVNAQQGRVQVDADWNEQIDIQEHLDQTFLNDIVGITGTPIKNSGFEISIPNPAEGNSYNIGKGRYYVDGILCENLDQKNEKKFINSKKEQEDLLDYSDKKLESPLSDYSAAPNQGDGLYVIYLDVWQRHITFLEDPDLREVALGGANTTTRTKTVWQAKSWLALEMPKKPAERSIRKTKKSEAIAPKVLSEDKSELALENFEEWVKTVVSKGTLSAQITPPKAQITPPEDGYRCLPLPESGYSGDENRLYRVEIHPSVGNTAGSPVLFKWSRENATVTARITNIEAGPKIEKKEMLITIQNTGKDDRTSLGKGQWIEVTDDYHELWNLPGRILQIIDIDDKPLENKKTLHIYDLDKDAENILNFNPPDLNSDDERYASVNPKVRRWNIPDDKWSILGYSNDPTKNKLSEQMPIYTASTTTYVPLEDGIEVKFSAGNYVPGDYWLFPARTITKSLEWPVEIDGITPKALPSQMQHHYCPLALVYFSGGTLEVKYDYRDFFASLTDQLSIYYVSGDGQEIQQTAEEKKTPFELQVGVAIGGVPLKNTSEWKHWKPRVLFTAEQGNGTLARTKDRNGTGTIITDINLIADVNEEGIAKCFWTLHDTNILQHVRAQMIDQKGEAFGLPLFFNGHLPIAFYYISGDGQEVTSNNVFFYRKKEELKEITNLNKESTSEFIPAKEPDKSLKIAEKSLTGEEKRVVTPILLKIGATMGDSPLESVPSGKFVVKFEIVDEDKDNVGSLCKVDAAFENQTSQVKFVEVDLENGMALCNWAFSPPTELKLGDQVSPGKQQVKATLMMKPTGPVGNNQNVPTQLPPVYFNATFSLPTLNYVSGDGQNVKQEVKVNLVPFDLMAAVNVNGVPVPSNMASLWRTKVLFEVTKGDGTLSALNRPFTKPLETKLADYETEDGAVGCQWKLDDSTLHQQVKATLISLNNKSLSPPLFYSASLPISFYYISGDGQEVNATSNIIPLSVGGRIGAKSLEKYLVQFKITKGSGNLSAEKSEATENSLIVPFEKGTADCIWSLTAAKGEIKAKGDNLGQYQVEATLLDETAKGVTKLPPVYFNALLVPEASQATSTTSGIAQLEYPPANEVSGPLFSLPIKHRLENIDTPPAIILSMLPYEATLGHDLKDLPAAAKTVVDYYEDQCLYGWAAISDVWFPHFKPVDVNLETFRILIEPPYPGPSSTSKWHLRWWALPAQHAGEDVARFLPKMSIENTELNGGVPFWVKVETLPGGSNLYVELSLTSLTQTFSILLVEQPAKSGVYISRLSIQQKRILAIDNETGKVLTQWTPNTILSDGPITLKYTYGTHHSRGTLIVKANLSKLT
jgi:hypothetical protein